MSLKDQLQHDLQDAMRARDERRKSVLRMALAAIQLAEVEQRATLEDAAVVDVIRREVRRREDALEMIRQAGRDELAEEEIAELDILRAYLPRLLGAEEVRAVAQEAIAEVGASSPADMGKVMQVLMPRLKGTADGRLVNQIVRELLSA
jgi:hypothetical protein